jgi:beta-N-acetylhexosaminidase
MKPLAPDQQHWVDSTLAGLTLEEQVGQLLIAKIDGDAQVDALVEFASRVPLGGAFVWGATEADHRRRLGRLQAASRIPVVIAADLENGAGHVVFGRTQFPDTLALAATGREELAYAMGKAAALEGRAAGIHWTFAPVVDVNVNPDNPIANTRSFGDNPDRIARFASAVIRGMQDHGLAACAKHFPGDGIDDVDQHAVTSVNSLSLEDWKRISGRTFSAAFADGVLSTMIGHIALPAWDPETDARGALRPATVNRRIVTDLLRREMGYEGLIVTDDMLMGGVSGYMNHDDRTIACIAAGCDMLLFPVLPRDYDTLVAAVRSGKLPAGRVLDGARRVLEFKARLGLHRGELIGRAPTADEHAAFEKAAREAAEQSICCVRDVHRLLPLKSLKPGAPVLTVTLSNEHMDLPNVDEELQRRGFRVTHILNPGCAALDALHAQFDAIFVNFMTKADWGVGSPRSVGDQNRVFMGGFQMEHPCVVFTSFGSPYHLRQFGWLANYINVHSSSPASQRAAVAAWLGEIPVAAKSPVGNLERRF